MIHLHRWGEWQDGLATMTFPLSRRECEVQIQFKRCSKCQKLKTRTV